MMNFRRFSLLATIAVLCAALGLKTARYARGAAETGGSVDERIAQFMAREGWQPIGPKSARKGDLYEWMAFSRTGCARAVTIGLLGANTENGELFRRDHAGDVVFLQGRKILMHPSGLDRQITGLADAVRRFAGLSVPQTLPLLAISPSPKRGVSSPAPAGADQGRDDCRGPSAAAWQMLAAQPEP